MSILTVILLLPLLALAALAAWPSRQRVMFQAVTIGITFVELVLASLAAWQFDVSAAQSFQFVQKVPWIPSLGISFHVGVDGLSVGLVWMATLVSFAAACASWEIRERVKTFHLLLLLMNAGVLGAFASLDLFFFYIFHELALVPTFLMIGIWGRGGQRSYAAFKITLYLGLGSMVLLLGLLAVFFLAGQTTFDMVELAAQARQSPFPVARQQAVFPLLLLGFGILASLWPFHTWAPLAYGAAPTPTAMLHAGALKKFGLYGLLRVALPLVPDGARDWMSVLAWLALGNLLFCGLVAVRQKELDRLIGYSSVAHMGFIFLGIASGTALGITGAAVVMVAHGMLAALSFGLSGHLYQQTRTLELDRLGGLLRPMPFLGTALVMAMLAACGVPGFGNFPGELLVFFGSWPPRPAATAIAAAAALVVGAVYALRAVRKALHGPLPDAWQAADDLSNPWRRLPFVLLLAGLIGLGCFPGPLVDRIQPAAAAIARPLESAPAPAALIPLPAAALTRPPEEASR
ncbi:MAG TPA: NADH-quinone oxidoreductase subunit M [Candidatus Paceibacterota bacterium]|nr:NADH-quinone oxidoreductase subunit M [Verrucomicrobiota bacterium]HRZ43929.1 NADH-quinone oxidoreductase subunit M [Candidatus Paceibacterota bacterium]HRZ94077.1 NADH-quinone oxidoreductase subunit M [Candidatus Paceibacterota bacterium]